ncbi:alkene reductase [Aquimarina sediminis]|uniref:alkene reductase n=1 Tax=Aquimarina sediminis TaxID=2070536 RepID=UPI000CA047CB|nr:alkene reductase [Aquimarina sediminis]
MKVFQPYSLGSITLKNHIVMAPMTRSRAIKNTPNDMMALYYEQRSDAGLIITEGTSPSPNGLGYARIPGAFTDTQIEGWKNIASKVHNKDSKIFVQLMHCGRASAAPNLPEGAKVIAPSSIQLSGEIYTDTAGLQPYVIPEAMSKDEIQNTQKEYIESATNLVAAGIDGVELHSANGYLLDQFLNPASNVRKDEYGGSYKNRTRFLLELTQKTIDAIGANRVGVRISPYGVFNDMQGEYDDLIEMYSYLAAELAKLNIAYIHIVDHRGMGAPDFPTDIVTTIKEIFKGTIITGGNINTEKEAQAILDKGSDLAYIGRPYISNPNLVTKLKNNITLTQPTMDTFYTPGEVGYTDYASI